MRIAYLDCMSGISGDMTLAALLDLGVELEPIQAAIDSLGLPSCRLRVEEVKRYGFRATNLTVQHEPEHAHRHLHHITAMIKESQLTPRQQQLATDIFTNLATAEAKVHGSTLEKVHFHEVGAVDSIADIVGVAVGFDQLGVDRVTCSPIPTGTGFVQIAHGRVSIPAPATAELLTGIPLAPSEVEAELTTPTGAAIVATLAAEFGPLPAMTMEAIGFGAGDRELESQANVLRIVVGTVADSSHADRIMILESNLDDTTAEIIGHTMERLLEAGALDAYGTPIYMKKNRPATKLTVLCPAARQADMETILFRETGTLGIRRWLADRTTLQREPCRVQTSWGEVSGKRIVNPDGTVRFSPEYDACAEIARRQGLSVRSVMEAAIHAFDA